MKIASYSMQMQASNSLIQKHESHETSNFFTQVATQNSNTENTNTISFSKIKSQNLIFNEEDSLSTEDKIKKRIIELLLEQMTNQKEKISIYPSKNIESKESIKENNPYTNLISSTQNSWGFVYESSEEYYKKNTIDFEAKANIKTSNGEFNINLDLSFSQEFYEVHKQRIEIGTVKFEDPLIINFESTNNSFDNISKNLSFEFDINSNGTTQDLPLLKNGSGFIALDKNSNGIIENGKELFGPNTGNGFNELKEYDEDKNNWIDENDLIFKDLRVWEKTEDGRNNLLTLGQIGVGAIYLGSIESDFNYSKSISQENAKLKESSIFLKQMEKQD